MPACPAGHESAAEDFCDTCGRRMTPSAEPPVQSAPPPTSERPCPGGCGTIVLDDQHYCEHCGWDLCTAPPAWSVLVYADGAYFETVRAAQGEDADFVDFPSAYPERRFTLTGNELLIGRRSASHGIEPHIDLSLAPEDRAVSHRHARLVPQPGGSWAVVDLGSTNGTYLNNHDVAIAPHTLVPLSDGDRLHLGAWTALTLRVRKPDDPTTSESVNSGASP
jgi:FHA domain